jgi:hypothetical protein
MRDTPDGDYSGVLACAGCLGRFCFSLRIPRHPADFWRVIRNCHSSEVTGWRKTELLVPAR